MVASRFQTLYLQRTPKSSDKDAGVKYFTFSNDQWVSFDDPDTFKQKTYYANDVGLGWLMIWSIDQDGKQFTALEGLLGTTMQAYDLNLKWAEVTAATGPPLMDSNILRRTAATPPIAWQLRNGAERQWVPG
ncbi:hypothetical protein BDV11DRAFT_175229 [Aspergillus similis]